MVNKYKNIVFRPHKDYGDYIICDLDTPYEEGLDTIREMAHSFIPEEFRTGNLVIGGKRGMTSPEDDEEPKEALFFWWKYSPLFGIYRYKLPKYKKKNPLTDK